MDSLTHLVLGASLGETAGRERLGRWAPAWGAAIATLPDVDVAIGQWLPTVQRLTLHRGPTHSLLFVAVAALALGWLISRAHRHTAGLGWAAMFAAMLMLAQIGLDCLTAYGTRLFWPFSDYSVDLATIAVIDPLFTLPMLLGAMVWLWLRSTHPWRRRLPMLALALSSVYLASTLFNKITVTSVFREALAAQGISAQRLLVKPTIFNTLLWRGVAEADEGYWIGFYSHLDDDRQIDFQFFPHRHDKLAGARDYPAVRQLIDLMHGWYQVEQRDNGWQLNDMRYGQAFEWLKEDRPFVFSYRIRPGGNSEVSVKEVTLAKTRDRERDRATLRALYERVLGNP